MIKLEEKISVRDSYNKLHKNINWIIALREELFTQQRVKDFHDLHKKIRLSNVMFGDFLNALYNLFLLVLKLLDSTLTMYSRTFKNSYSRKYRKRVNRLLDEFVSPDFVIRLTEDLTKELNKKFGYFEVELSVAHNINNVEVSPYNNSNFNSLPMAVQMPNRMASAIGRELPFANSYVVGNANVNRNLNGSTNRSQSRMRNGNTNLNRSMNRWSMNQSTRQNGMGNIHNTHLNGSINRIQSRRRNRNTHSNRSMNRRQTLRLNRMGNDLENTSLNSPPGISI